MPGEAGLVRVVSVHLGCGSHRLLLSTMKVVLVLALVVALVLEEMEARPGEHIKDLIQNVHVYSPDYGHDASGLKVLDAGTSVVSTYEMNSGENAAPAPPRRWGKNW
ncbi:uncharacterized protein [Cherax quadricarinatus]|uniref:uncharacterized protein isoform X2 n=1 Tax=Cherax quadricarinatus TaxID=27406 RepID=UPI002377E657|nr:uncharacterized protein LOC128695953 isoform X2 [Cherax quadricarinatus]